MSATTRRSALGAILAFSLPFCGSALTHCSSDPGAEPSPSEDGAATDTAAGEDGPVDDGTDTGTVFDGAPTDASDSGIAPSPPCITLDPAWPAGGKLVDTGHGMPIVQIFRQGDRVVALSEDRQWILWNVASATIVARGTGTHIDAQGSAFLVRNGSNVEIRSMTTGAMTSSFAAGVTAREPRLATDASYVWSYLTPATLEAWSLTGTSLVSISGCGVGQGPGDVPTRVHAGPAALRIMCGFGVADSRTTEVRTYPIDGSASTTLGPYSGAQQVWSSDGQRFVLKSAADFFVKAQDGSAIGGFTTSSVDEAIAAHGNHVVVAGASTGPRIWRVVAGQSSIDRGGGKNDHDVNGAAAALSGPFLLAKDIYDLSKDPPTKVARRPRTNTLGYEVTFAADGTTGAWVIGDGAGLLHSTASISGDPSAIGCGMVVELSGSSTGKLAISTASGHIALVDPAAKTIVERTFAPSTIALSADGQRLARATLPDSTSSLALQTLEVLSTTSWAPTFTRNATTAIAVAVDGTGAHATSCGPSSCLLLDVGAATSSSMAISHTTTPWTPAALSPDGLKLAVANTSGSRLYVNGALAGALGMDAATWLGNDSVIGYDDQANLTKVFDASGALVSSSAGFSGYNVVRVDATSTLQPGGVPRIYDVTTGAATWTSARDPATSTQVRYGGRDYEGRRSAAVAGAHVAWPPRIGGGVVVEAR